MTHHDQNLFCFLSLFQVVLLLNKTCKGTLNSPLAWIEEKEIGVFGAIPWALRPITQAVGAIPRALRTIPSALGAISGRLELSPGH